MIIMILGRKKKNEKREKDGESDNNGFPLSLCQKNKGQENGHNSCPLMEKAWPFGTR